MLSLWLWLCPPFTLSAPNLDSPAVTCVARRQIMHSLSGPGHHLSYMEQCQGNMGQMAIHYGQVRTYTKAPPTTTSPQGDL